MTTSSESAPRDQGLSSFILKNERLFILGVVGIGLLMRIAHFFQIEANDPFFYFPSVDPGVYHNLASRIAGGEGVGNGVFFLSPLYPYALSFLYTITGPSLYAARLAGLILGAGNCALIYLLGNRTLGVTTGALAALVWSIYSMSIFYDGTLLVTSLQTPLNLLLALALTRARSDPRMANWALSGMLLGLSALARPNILLLLVMILPWMFFSLRRLMPSIKLLAAVIVLVLATAATILPVTIRNYVVADDFVLISAQGGANFYIGNGPGATGVFRVPNDFPPTNADDPTQQRKAYKEAAQKDLGRSLRDSEISTYWWNRALSHIVDNPGDALGLAAIKLGLFFNEFEPGNSRDFASSREFSKVLSLPLPSFDLIAPLALLGMVLAWRRNRSRAACLYGMVLTYAASLVIFFVLSHYRMPVVPFLLLFAAHALVRLLEATLKKETTFAIMATSALALAVFATQLNLVDETGDRFIVHYNLGNKYRQLRKTNLAIEEYEKSIRLNPDYISSNHNLAMMTERLPDQLQKSINAWRAVLRLGKANKDPKYIVRAEKHLTRLLGTEKKNRPHKQESINTKLLADYRCPDCNVLLITIETLRADRLQCQGYGVNIAPNICDFGQSGLLFENAFSPAPVTAPALRSIMSGSLVSNSNLLEIVAHHDAGSSLAAKLSKAGYKTAGITDHMGMGDLSSLRPKSSVIIRDFDHFLNLGEGRKTKTSAKVAVSVNNWLSEHTKEKFFLWTHLFDPHYNWVPAKETLLTLGCAPNRCGRIEPGMDIEDIRAIEKDLSDDEIECLQCLYHGEVFETDKQVKTILDKLEQLGLKGNTLVIITGDHGEEFKERSRIGHEWTVYNELLHVPLMIRNPRSLLSDWSKEPISTLAIHDFVISSVTGKNLDDLPPVVSRSFHYYGRNTQHPSEFETRPNEYSLVQGKLKFIYTPRENKRELYDLAADPGEHDNLYGKHPQGESLLRSLDAWMMKNKSDADPADNDAIQSYLDMVERLRTLGYTR